MNGSEFSSIMALSDIWRKIVRLLYCILKKTFTFCSSNTWQDLEEIWDLLLRNTFFWNININMLFQYLILFKGDGTCFKNCHSTALPLTSCYAPQPWSLLFHKFCLLSSLSFKIQVHSEFLVWHILSFTVRSWSSFCVLSLFLTWLYSSSQSSLLTLSISRRFWCLMSPSQPQCEVRSENGKMRGTFLLLSTHLQTLGKYAWHQ